MNYRALWPLWVAALLGGCTLLDVPSVESHLSTGQKQARAVHHWDVLADDVAARIAEKTRDWPAGAHPIFVSPSGDSPFNAGFRKLLITHLLDRGVALSTQPAEVQLVFETQLVQHLKPKSSALHGLPLAVGVRDGERQFGSSVAAGADPEGRAAEAPALGVPARTEVLITTSLASGGRYLAGTADMYYIEHDDARLYQSVDSPAPPPVAVSPTAVKAWKVVTP